jgi:Domain of unknown function (DUF1905)
MERLTHTAVLWRWNGGNGGNWFFVTIDGEAGEVLSATALMRRLELGHARGFGAIKVTALIGQSRWSTSAFPAKQGGYMLPVKAAVRRAEQIGEGDEVDVALEF